MLQPIPEEEGYEDKIAREEETTINNKPKVQLEETTINKEKNKQLEEKKPWVTKLRNNHTIAI
jgi:hypothetical protein